MTGFRKSFQAETKVGVMCEICRLVVEGIAYAAMGRMIPHLAVFVHHFNAFNAFTGFSASSPHDEGHDVHLVAIVQGRL